MRWLFFSLPFSMCFYYFDVQWLVKTAKDTEILLYGSSSWKSYYDISCWHAYIWLWRSVKVNVVQFSPANILQTVSDTTIVNRLLPSTMNWHNYALSIAIFLFNLDPCLRSRSFRKHISWKLWPIGKTGSTIAKALEIRYPLSIGIFTIHPGPF